MLEEQVNLWNSMFRLFFISIILWACSSPAGQQNRPIMPGAEQLTEYLPLLRGKKVGLTVNHSSLVGSTHLTDTLMNHGIYIAKVFTPEHGFKGTVSDGVEIAYDSATTSYQLISLYGKHKKPTPEQMSGLDVMLFDIQDVGARFYTYISTMHYVMEACAQSGVPLIVLDRPNPNGSYVDGPVLDTALSSFVGMHPIPIVHGMTVGELAQMINREGWLQDQQQVNLQVIKVKNWNHRTPYVLPVRPSPNLPNQLSVSLYPSLCLFEGTLMSVGRGTDHPFQQVGHPDYPDTTHWFVPRSTEGSRWPPYENQKCYGRSWIGQHPVYRFTLEPLIQTYKLMSKEDFFNDYFNRLAGTSLLQKQIVAGQTEEQIRASWEPELSNFKNKRKKYLLYEE